MIKGKRIENELGLDIVVVSDPHGILLNELTLIDALVLNISDDTECLELLFAIRSSMIEPIYLLPIFVFSKDNKVSKTVSELADAIVLSFEAEMFLEKISALKKKSLTFNKSESSTESNRILTKVIRYLYTRGKDLYSVVDGRFFMGYLYPILCNGWFDKEMSKKMEALNKGAEGHYLEATYLDMLHPCPQCQSTHISIREVCPKCGSSHLKSENLIHHFVCANVAPESAYLQEDGLVCPKCNRRLRHIGVDYDKPSFVYSCFDCSHQFQAADMNALCFHCGSITDIEALPTLEISNYSITKKGEDSTRNGVDDGEVKEEFLLNGFVTFSMFRTFLEYEIKKQSVAGDKLQSQLVRISIHFPQKIEAVEAKEQLLTDVGEFIKNSSSAVDILTLLGIHSFFVLIPNEEKKSSENRLMQVKQTIERLLQSNFSDDDDWNIDMHIERITSKISTEEILTIHNA